MTRPEDSPWAVAVAQVGSRPGQSEHVDGLYPAPSGIGDEVIGVKEGDDVHVEGSFDSIVDGLMLSAHVDAPVHAECSRCLKPIHRNWGTNVTAFFPYELSTGHGNAKDRSRYGNRDTDDELDIIAGEDESEDIYPLSPDGAFADLELLLRDTLVELLPLQPLCRPDCKGLCPQCGIDLNTHPNHHHDVTDIRFAALADLKAQMERQEQNGDQEHN